MLDEDDDEVVIEDQHEHELDDNEVIIVVDDDEVEFDVDIIDEIEYDEYLLLDILLLVDMI